MNRRSFLKGGGIFTAVAAAVALAKMESHPRGAMVPCSGAHQAQDEFTKGFACIAIGAGAAKFRELVPCEKCGVLFALPGDERSKLSK